MQPLRALGDFRRHGPKGEVPLNLLFEVLMALPLLTIARAWWLEENR